MTKEQESKANTMNTEANPTGLNGLMGMIIYGGGLMVFFLIYGLLQERIMTRPYGDERFTESTYLVLNNRFVAACVAMGLMLWGKENVSNVAPIHKYFSISFSNTAATVCQYEALKYVSFPTQTLGKCGKMIPVMILGTFISQKQYTLKDYSMAVAVTIGCAIFILTGDISTDNGHSDSLWGLILMGGYVFCDGFTSTFQEKLFHGYSMSTYNQMLYVNLCSGTISCIALLMKGTLFSSIAFSLEHPAFAINAFCLSLAATFGQIMIYYSIKKFGALFFSTVMTTRQVVGILLSCLIFFHPLSVGQIIGCGIVFCTLYYKATSRTKKVAPPPAAEPVAEVPPTKA